MDLQALSLGLYVHVPFCANECAYCNFYKQRPTRVLVQNYLSEIQQEYLQWREQLLQRKVNTLFFGGGSPSSLSCEQLSTLCEMCEELVPQLSEWTVEISPTTVNLEKLKILKAYSVTRISMGVQSFQQETINYLGRRQSNVQVYRAYDWIRTAGFSNVNLDFIFPPNFLGDISLWQRDLNEMVRLKPEHISTYCLSFERETGPFCKSTQVDEDREAQFYQHTWDFLRDNGYEHYEVSNFAKPDHACLHNLNTWRMQEWIGLGPSAASQMNGQRFQNQHFANGWLKEPKINCENLSDEMLFVDSLVFGLRTRRGINLKALTRRFPQANAAKYEPLWSQFADEKLIHYQDDNVYCTDKGLLVVDALAREIFNL